MYYIQYISNEALNKTIKRRFNQTPKKLKLLNI